jgi:hypothetical protein
MRSLLIAAVLVAGCHHRDVEPEPRAPVPDEHDEARVPALGTKENPIVETNGLRTWREGDTNVLEVAAPLWCFGVESGGRHCFFTQGECDRQAVLGRPVDGCAAQNNAACTTAHRKLDGTTLVDCWSTMQLCGEAWINLQADFDYSEVHECSVARYLGR